MVKNLQKFKYTSTGFWKVSLRTINTLYYNLNKVIFKSYQISQILILWVKVSSILRSCRSLFRLKLVFLWWVSNLCSLSMNLIFLWISKPHHVIWSKCWKDTFWLWFSDIQLECEFFGTCTDRLSNLFDQLSHWDQTPQNQNSQQYSYHNWHI